MNSILSYALVSLFDYVVDIPMDGWWSLLGVAQFVPAFTLVPRFILGLRQLYARDVQGRRGSDIDTAFGLTSAFDHAASAIVFADGGQNEGEEQGDSIQMEAKEGHSADGGA